MIDLYCHDHHSSTDTLCENCTAVQHYANDRLSHCPYGLGKPTCKDCPIHCYREEMKRAVKDIMRYSGPKMLLKHPYLAIMHLIDGRRKGAVLNSD